MLGDGVDTVHSGDPILCLPALGFQIEVAGLDALLARTTQAGYRFLSVGGKPIQRPFGRFVFAIDPDGVLVEFVEPR